ncbi:hypothetical protein Trco_007316 [Trichoderma cornu-damae]|uniref:Uncharacterized protein n=1 Tax=Trichoderma cornu-damae TaxID=654480 RepID=A0A9P8QJ33_9HYPO|nr:hypothetical protein Trco_007316 [Trichoderma cornu-damae]
MQLLALLAASVVAAQAPPAAEPISPDHESAKANANHIFNAIHSAGRQWGSSLNHNGFGFIPVVVPAGTLLYHGGHSDRPPEGPEWLAFEVEHAAFFARGPLRGHRGRRPEQEEEELHLSSPAQKPISQPETDGPPDGPPDGESEGRVRGYFQTYQTTRNVQLLYLDGTSAGKSPMGTLDQQDDLLCQDCTTDGSITGGEMCRAKTMCDLVAEWGWDGIMRMEIGFEVIFCDFSSGLQLDSSLRTVPLDHKLQDDGFLTAYLWSRAAAERYGGIGGDRVQMDFSSMVSGFFFPINISNTDPDRPDLIRLNAAKREHLTDIRAYLQSVFSKPRKPKPTVNWQAVVDMIVTRFSKRLAAMASTSISTDVFIGELEGVALTYYEAPRLPDDITATADDDGKNRTAEAADRCAAHYLKPALPSRQDWTLHDNLIHTALRAVMERICSDLYLMRSTLLRADPDTAADAFFIKKGVESAEMDKAVNQSRVIVRNLMDELAWTTWKMPPLCAEDEMLLTAMWPIGDRVDHFNPGCVSIEEVVGERRSYWAPCGRGGKYWK